MDKLALERAKNRQLRKSLLRLENQKALDRELEEKKLRVQCRMAALDYCLGPKAHWQYNNKGDGIRKHLEIAKVIADFMYMGSVTV